MIVVLMYPIPAQLSFFHYVHMLFARIFVISDMLYGSIVQVSAQLWVLVNIALSVQHAYAHLCLTSPVWV
jgi:hypothetical protein